MSTFLFDATDSKLLQLWLLKAAAVLSLLVFNILKKQILIAARSE